MMNCLTHSQTQKPTRTTLSSRLVKVDMSMLKFDVDSVWMKDKGAPASRRHKKEEQN